MVNWSDRMKDLGSQLKDIGTQTAIKGAKATGKAAKEGAKVTKNQAVKFADQKAKESSEGYRDLRKVYDQSKKAGKAAGKAFKGAKTVGKGLKALRHPRQLANNMVLAVKNQVKRAKKAIQKGINIARWGARAVGWLIGFLSTPAGWITALVVLTAIGAMNAASATNQAAERQERYQQVSSLEQYKKTIKNSKRAVLLSDNCVRNKEVTETSKKDGGISSGDLLGADWTVKGSKAYENAKSVFDAWVKAGVSGAYAAGIVGWVDSEGGFSVLGRAEGYYGSDVKTNSIAYGVVPIPSGPGYGVGGGGIYQFTPYTKFAPLNSPDWEDADKQTQFVIKSIASGDWNASMDMTGGNHSFQEAVQMTDPKEATLTWQAYERGNTALIPRAKKQLMAQKAYELFEGEKYKYDEAKFKAVFGGGGSASSASTETEKEDDDPCADEEKTETGGSWGDVEDGTGSVSYSSENAWKNNELPADLKKYALDPESVGMKFGDANSWNPWPGDQCTNLTAVLMYHLFSKKGQHPTMLQGNGIDVARNWASQYGLSLSKKPKAGSVFSSSGDSVYGHTGVISHVFANGDVLLIEQNYLGMSGAAVGQSCTWNYRYMKAADIASWDFAHLSGAGYSFVSGAKSK